MKKIALLTLVALPLLFVLINYSAAQSPTPRPDFIISCPNSTITTQPGVTVKYDLTIAPVNGFRGTVDLACVPTPRVACNLSTNSVSLGADLNVPFSVIVMTNAGTALGTYPIIANAKGTYGSNLQTGTVSHDYLLHLTLAPAGAD